MFFNRKHGQQVETILKTSHKKCQTVEQVSKNRKNGQTSRTRFQTSRKSCQKSQKRCLKSRNKFSKKSNKIFKHVERVVKQVKTSCQRIEKNKHVETSKTKKQKNDVRQIEQVV